MSSDLFHAAHIKARRAKKHIASVESELRAVIAAHGEFLSAVSIVGVFGDGLTPELSIPEDDLDEIACCVGDAIHNLRSALDLLACEVVERSGNSPKDVHFPFADTQAGLTAKSQHSPPGGMIKRHHFDRARSDAVTAVLALAPHGESSGNALLYGLHQLDKIDKHRDIIALTTDQPAPGMFFMGSHLKPDDYTSPKLVFTAGIPLAGEEVVTVLERLSGELERAIKTFSDLGW